jgi:diacylglycerol kinase (ATP)
MRVLLIYNPNAGDGVHDQLRDLVDVIHAAGHQVRCRSSKDPQVVTAFAEPTDLVAVAGGDGTIAKVARLLRGRDTAIAPLPVGTANNIATALGLTASSLEEQILGWTNARAIALDVGLARSPRGSRSFLESCGAGLIPRLLTLAKSRDPPRLASSAETRLESALARARRTARRSPAIEIRAVLDGQDISGRYVLIEAMNLGWVGPNLNLAADADPSDGLLDVVLVSEAERSLLSGYLDYLDAREDGVGWPHAFPTVRGRHLRIAQTDLEVHVGDELWTSVDADQGDAFEVTLRDRAWFLVPAQQASLTAWMRGASGRDLGQSERAAPARVTPSRWAWPGGGRARFHR